MARAGLALALALAASAAGAEPRMALSGHGGPIMDIAVSPDGARALTGSFDYSVGLWTLGDESPPRWLEGHDAAVNFVEFLGNDRALSAGDDFAVILWDLAAGAPLRRFEGHRGKVTAARVAPDGETLASASWDGSVRLWSLSTGAPRGELRGHASGVNDLVWAEGGRRLYSAGQDGVILEWDAAAGAPLRTLARHGFGVNKLLIDEARGWLAYGAVDGGTRALDLGSGAELADLTLERRPILALARTRDGALVAIGDGEGYIMVVETEGWAIERDFRAALRGPIWALDFTADRSAVIAGGIADEARRFPIGAAEARPRFAAGPRSFQVDPARVSNGERQFMRKCSVCHELGADGKRRAGPPLHGLFGRRAGSLPGYAYSDALKGSDIVWGDATIDRLFDLGPEHVTPGSKMPMQRIASPDDRAELIDFLRRETARSAN